MEGLIAIKHNADDSRTGFSIRIEVDGRIVEVGGEGVTRARGGEA